VRKDGEDVGARNRVLLEKLAAAESKEQSLSLDLSQTIEQITKLDLAWQQERTAP
jgi:hypothetical protein